MAREAVAAETSKSWPESIPFAILTTPTRTAAPTAASAAPPLATATVTTVSTSRPTLLTGTGKRPGGSGQMVLTSPDDVELRLPRSTARVRSVTRTPRTRTAAVPLATVGTLPITVPATVASISKPILITNFLESSLMTFC